jgi:hypothetical protein
MYHLEVIRALHFRLSAEKPSREQESGVFDFVGTLTSKASFSTQQPNAPRRRQTNVQVCSKLALPQKLTFGAVSGMSALCPIVLQNSSLHCESATIESA